MSSMSVMMRLPVMPEQPGFDLVGRHVRRVGKFTFQGEQYDLFVSAVFKSTGYDVYVYARCSTKEGIRIDMFSLSGWDTSKAYETYAGVHAVLSGLFVSPANHMISDIVSDHVNGCPDRSFLTRMRALYRFVDDALNGW